MRVLADDKNIVSYRFTRFDSNNLEIILYVIYAAVGA